MITTNELKKKIKDRICSVIPDFEFSQVSFCEATYNSPDGIYFYLKNDDYCMMIVEKGVTKKHTEHLSEDDVLWYVLDYELFHMAMNYAIENKKDGMDFRRILFQKEIELFSMFGSDYKSRKAEEISGIPEENPYCDRQ